MTVEITDILDQIMAMNINRCAITTYDLGVQECARQEIVRALAQQHGIAYNIRPRDTKIFPVKGTSA
jgi:predicted transposase YbfD/YdcC